MSQAGYTPILIYGSTTAGNTPSAANMTTSASGVELAINAFDGKLFYKDSGGTVQVLAVKMPSGILPIANGGTNATATPTAGAVAYGTGSAYAFTAAGTSNQVLISNGASAPTWSNLSSIGVTTFSAGTTGFTPSSATSGAVTLAGTLATTNGGTGLTSFTANGVVYASSTSALTTGSALTFDGTNLGLGVTPSAWDSQAKAIQISSHAGFATYTGGTNQQALLLNNAYLSSTGYKYLNSNYATLYQQQASAGTHAWFTAPSGTAGNAISFSQVMTLDSSGNLGLGVTPSTWTVGKVFQIGATGNGFLYGATTSGTSTIYGVNARYASGWIYDANGYSTRYNQDAGSGEHQWFTAPSGTAGNAISFTQAMTLDTNGNLGIGTTSPDVLGLSYGRVLGLSSASSVGLEMNAAFGSTSNIDMAVNGTRRFQAEVGNSEVTLKTRGAVPLLFGTDNTERMRLDSSGNLLVGTTTTGLGNTAGFGFNGSQYLSIGHTSGTGNGTEYLSFGYDGTKIGSITQNGTTGVLYNLTSDYRLKNNPVALTGSGEFIDALQPKTWDWWDGSGKGVGFIAHEFMEVAKYSGNGEKDAVDAEGNPVYQSIQPSSSEVIAYLVAEIQSLRKRLADAGIA